SRRRHTRSKRDWSSDVCSSDLVIGFAGGVADAVSLQDMLEGKLETYSGDLRRAAVEMAQSWRKDPTLAKLQAMVIAFNDKDLLRSEERRVGKGRRTRWWSAGGK